MYSYRVYQCIPRWEKAQVIPVDFRSRSKQIPCIRSSRRMVSEGWVSVDFAKKWADEHIKAPYTYEIRRYVEEETRFTKYMATVHPKFQPAAARLYKPIDSGISNSGIPAVELMKRDKTREDVLGDIWKIGRKAFGGTVSKHRKYLFLSGSYRPLDQLSDSEINHFLEVMYTGRV